MKIVFLMILLFGILSCPNSEIDQVKADENADICHTPLKIIDTGSTIIFQALDRDCKVVDETKIEKPKDGKDGKPGPKGPKGDPGRTGARGPEGPPGDGVDPEMLVCIHDHDHLDRTITIKQSDLIGTRWGELGTFDYAGPCEVEGGCRCDRCFDGHNLNPQIIH